jgi:hypothetical protein
MQSRPTACNARLLALRARPPLLAYARAHAPARVYARPRAYGLVNTILF